MGTAARLLGQADVDCMLLDQALPDGLGTDLLHRLHDSGPSAHPPTIMITGRGSEQVAVTAMKRGAIDYLAKDGISPEGLQRAVRHACQLRELSERLARERYARRLAEQALEAHELSLKTLFESIEQVAIVTLDADGHVLSWNQGARRLFDVHDQEILGQHADVLAAPVAGSEGIRGQMRAADGGGQPNQRRRFRRWSGEEFFGASVLSRIRDPSSGLRGYAWVVQEVGWEGVAAPLPK